MDEEIKQIQLEMLNELRALRESSTISAAGPRPSGIPTTAATGINTDSAERSIKQFGKKLDDIDKEALKYLGTYAGLTQSQIDQARAAASTRIALDGLTEGAKKSTQAFKDLGSELFSQKRGFDKYGQGLKGLGDAAETALSGLGKFGKFLGVVINVTAKIGAAYLKQADDLLKANDQLAQFGTAGSFTTKELMAMAHQAGVTSKNMELFTKPIASLGPNLLLLGKNTGESVKAFADLTKISNAQREEYQRMGISQEQLIQTQADYIALQGMAGRNMKSELSDRAKLQKASLEYQDTLLELAALTGQDVDSLKRKQMDAQRAVEWQISQIQLENKARKLEAQGRHEEAAMVRQEAKNRVAALNEIASLGSETATKGVRAFLATGTYAAEETQSLIRMGLGDDLQALRKAIQNGEDAQLATAKFQNAYNEKFGKTVDNVGFAAQHSGEVAKQFGLTSESAEKYNQQRDTDFVAERNKVKGQQQEAKKPGKDPAQDARAKLTTLEIEAGKALDKLMAATNPLISGFNMTTIAATLAAAALGALALMAGRAAMTRMGQAGKDVLDQIGRQRGRRGAPRVPRGPVPRPVSVPTGGVPPVPATVATGAAGTAATGAAGAAGTASSALGALAGPLTKLATAAPLIGAGLAVGSGVISAYQGVKQVNKDVAEGKITKEEARTAKGEAIGGGTGTAIGGTAGALKGAAAGAAIGSVVPVLGTAVGGIIGAALGGWLGSKAGKAIGEVAGGSIAKMTADSDKEVEKAKKKAEEKTQPETANEKLKDAKSNEIAKVQIVNPLPLPVQVVKSVESLAKLTPEAKSPLVKTSAKTDSREMNLEELEAWKKKLIDKGPASESAMSQQIHKNMLQTLDKAIVKAKTTQSVNNLNPKDAGMSTSKQMSETDINKIFASSSVKEGASSNKIIETPTINVKLDKTQNQPFTLQKGFNTDQSLALKTKGMLDSTLPKATSIKEVEPETDKNESKQFFSNLLQSTDELTDSTVRFRRILDSVQEPLGNMTTTFMRYDQKLKREMLRDVPDELTEALDERMQEQLQKGMAGVESLRRQLRDEDEPAEGFPELSGGTGISTQTPSGGGGAGGGFSGYTPPPQMPPGRPDNLNQDVQKNLGDLKGALMAKGEKDEKYINAILGNVMKETGGKSISENLDYSKTSNQRIRDVFGKRAAGLTDAQLSDIKSDPQKMGEFMYGSHNEVGKALGNKEPGDGWKYRGRGYIGLTGRGNYAAASQAIFGDDRLVKDPDLVNDPKVAKEVVVWFYSRSKASMAKRMGIDPNNMSQSQANQLATSQTAGKPVAYGQGKFWNEVLGKVDRYSTQMAGVQPGEYKAGEAQMASAQQQPSSSASSGQSQGILGKVAGFLGFGKKEPPAGSHGEEGRPAVPADTSQAVAAAKDSKDPKDQVEKAGLKVRPYGDVYQGGLLTQTALQAARTAQDTVPDFGMFTGLNDVYHKIHHPRSKHAFGQGIDFTLGKMPTIEESKEIKGMLQKIPGVSLVMNEYYRPPHGDMNQHTTGPHFHFQTSAAEGAVIDGPDAGYPVDLTAHGREIIAPLQPNSVLEMMAKTPAGQTQDSTPKPIASPIEKPDEVMRDLYKLNEEMLSTMRDRFDQMIEKLAKSNETQDKLLQNARV